MSKKKSVLFIAIALVSGIAIGVSVTIGVMHNSNEGSILIPSETECVTDEYGYPLLNELLGCNSKCKESKILEVIKNDGVISKQRFISAKWSITFDGLTGFKSNKSELMPYFVKTSNGKKSVEKYLWYTSEIDNNRLKTVITYIPTDTDANIFTAPGEVDIDLCLFIKVRDKWISNDGRIMTTNPDAFLNGDYSNVIFYGTEADLDSSGYSFMENYKLEITYHDSTEMNNDIKSEVKE